MLAHEQRAPFLRRALGAHTPRGAGLSPRPRSQSGGVGGHSPAVAGGAAARLAHLVAPAVERSPAGPGQTAAARADRASARRATRTRWAYAGVGPTRGGGCHRACQARALSTLPVSPARGGFAAPAASGD